FVDADNRCMTGCSSSCGRAEPRGGRRRPSPGSRGARARDAAPVLLAVPDLEHDAPSYREATANRLAGAGPTRPHVRPRVRSPKFSPNQPPPLAVERDPTPGGPTRAEAHFALTCGRIEIIFGKVQR